MEEGCNKLLPYFSYYSYSVPFIFWDGHSYRVPEFTTSKSYRVIGDAREITYVCPIQLYAGADKHRIEIVLIFPRPIPSRSPEK